jgi:hypothetical protein
MGAFVFIRDQLVHASAELQCCEAACIVYALVMNHEEKKPETVLNDVKKRIAGVDVTRFERKLSDENRGRQSKRRSDHKSDHAGTGFPGRVDVHAGPKL